MKLRLLLLLGAVGLLALGTWLLLPNRDATLAVQGDWVQTAAGPVRVESITMSRQRRGSVEKPPYLIAWMTQHRVPGVELWYRMNTNYIPAPEGQFFVDVEASLVPTEPGPVRHELIKLLLDYGEYTYGTRGHGWTEQAGKPLLLTFHFEVPDEPLPEALQFYWGDAMTRFPITAQ